jgi:phage major head subunit gpT-like protein
MGASSLSSRGIIGAFFAQLAIEFGASWISQLGMYFPSDQESETYKWLGMVPQMREWTGKRHAKGFWENGITILNKKYESTLEISVDDLRRDKTQQILVRVREQAIRAMGHWAKLIADAEIAGESALCYDGQFFFDDDHVEGNNVTAQSNDLAIDISELPAAVHGSTTAPSAQEMMLSIFQCITAILGFKDDQNEPFNETAKQFLVRVPVTLFPAAASAVSSATFGAGETNVLKNAGFTVNLAMNPRSTWTNKIVVYRADGNVKPFILQEEKPISIKAIAEGSELEFNEDKHHYGIDAIRNVGYGYWQHACLATFG